MIVQVVDGTRKTWQYALVGKYLGALWRGLDHGVCRNLRLWSAFKCTSFELTRCNKSGTWKNELRTFQYRIMNRIGYECLRFRNSDYKFGMQERLQVPLTSTKMQAILKHYAYSRFHLQNCFPDWFHILHFHASCLTWIIQMCDFNFLIISIVFHHITRSHEDTNEPNMHPFEIQTIDKRCWCRLPVRANAANRSQCLLTATFVVDRTPTTRMWFSCKCCASVVVGYSLAWGLNYINLFD